MTETTVAAANVKIVHEKAQNLKRPNNDEETLPASQSARCMATRSTIRLR